ncbi:hypothetical protein V6N11_001647 [Hibiscus sabdariffa]|uniref:(+)-delta-cadinene synthase n=1 Tax=Hibiscus sabdariffa TaxID=183260 RepID=A0ABR1ZUJ6_9ROSI
MEQLLTASPCIFSATTVTDYSRNLVSPWRRLGRARVLRRVTTISKLSTLQPIQRRSANYHPSVWEPALIESLTTPFSYEVHGARLEDLKNQARNLLEHAQDPCSTLKLIDSLQRLGVSYHFGKEIDEALDNVIWSKTVVDDLYTTSLMFRILREHGYPIGTDVFEKFRGGDRNFVESLGSDAEAILSLYEASHLGMHGEDVMEEAKEFSAKHLKSSLGKLDCDLAMQVQQSLQVPLHWRMPRTEAMNYIHAYQKYDTSHSALIELAKLDYNLVQAVYQQELRELASWWGELGFKEKMSFSRDRLMENYIWAMGIVFEPQLSKCRTNLTKFVCILTAIDDMYDVYGTLPELELFTEAVNQWDITAMKDLPEFMWACYLALLDFVNDLELEILKDHGSNTTHYIKNGWKKLCQSYLTEARWFYNRYTPGLEEYLENAWTSVGGPAAIVHAYTLQAGLDGGKSASIDHSLKHGAHRVIITKHSSCFVKAESARGDTAKSIECYIVEVGASKEEAMEHVRCLLARSWEKLNEESLKSLMPRSMIKMCLNMARTSQCLYQHGDGIGTSNGATEDLLMSLIVQTIK